jgi:hypothetical protein
MINKCYSSLLNLRRRRRYYLLRIISILICIGLFFQIKYNVFYSTSKKSVNNNTSCTNVSFNNPILNCSGDPLKQWCENEMKLCNSNLIVYNKLFLVTRSVILQPKFATGKRLGGEDIELVLNQPEKHEYFYFEKEFVKVKVFLLFITEINIHFVDSM